MKFKVFQAIARTFVFTGRNWLPVLKIVWLPCLLQLVAFIVLMSSFMVAYIEAQTYAAEEGAEAWSRLLPVAPQGILFFLLTCVLTIIMFSGLTKLVVRGEKPRLPFYLAWGADEFRLLTAWAIQFAIIIGIVIAYFVANLLAQGMMSLAPGGVGLLFGILGAVGVAILATWVGVRLSFIAPETIAHRKVGVSSSWEMTEDYYWPLLGFWIIWAIIAQAAQWSSTPYVLPPGYFEAMQNADFTSREGMQQAMREANLALAAGYDMSDIANVLRTTLAFFINFLGSIVIAMAGAVSWKMMTDPDFAEPVKPAPDADPALPA
ncbi:MAG: hypothetical protein Q8R02_04975 [Hyphomonadaceae bacterium]|nr:hypothetical protein [Hyphomonadaceae bacterium]